MSEKPDRLSFEWDDDKASINLRKHKVSFEEASTVFDDFLSRLDYDHDHSDEENRELIIGHSILKRLIIVSFTERTAHRIRIISARVADRRERKSYEEDESN